jgi:Flp pilus assembly pilin Flp
LAARHALGLWRDESGATAIEYGLIIGAIFLVVVAGYQAIGSSNNGMWAKIGNRIAAL